MKNNKLKPILQASLICMIIYMITYLFIIKQNIFKITFTNELVSLFCTLLVVFSVVSSCFIYVLLLTDKDDTMILYKYPNNTYVCNITQDVSESLNIWWKGLVVLVPQKEPIDNLYTKKQFPIFRYHIVFIWKYHGRMYSHLEEQYDSDYTNIKYNLDLGTVDVYDDTIVDIEFKKFIDIPDDEVDIDRAYKNLTLEHRDLIEYIPDLSSYVGKTIEYKNLGE